MNEKLLKLLNGNESLYPRNLEEKYPRVFEKIHQLWNTAELDAYLDELMMDSRGGHRNGRLAGLALVPVFLPWRLVIELLGMLGYGRRSWGRIARADHPSQHVNR